MLGDIETGLNDVPRLSYAKEHGQPLQEPVVGIGEAHVGDVADEAPRQAADLTVIDGDWDHEGSRHVDQRATEVSVGSAVLGSAVEGPVDAAQTPADNEGLSKDVPAVDAQRPEEVADDSPRADVGGVPPIEPPDGPPPTPADGGEPDDSGEGSGRVPTRLQQIDVKRFDDEPLPLTTERVRNVFKTTLERVDENPAFPKDTIELGDDGFPVSVSFTRLVTDLDGGKAHFDIGEDVIGAFFTTDDGATSVYHTYSWDSEIGAVVRTDADLDTVLGGEGEEFSDSPQVLFEETLSKLAEMALSPDTPGGTSQWEVGEGQMDYIAELLEAARPVGVTFDHLADVPLGRLSGELPLPSRVQSEDSLPGFHQMLADHQAEHGDEPTTHEDPNGVIRVEFNSTDTVNSAVRVDLEQKFEQLSYYDKIDLLDMLHASPGMEPVLANTTLVKRLHYTNTTGALVIYMDGYVQFGESDQRINLTPDVVIGDGKDTALLGGFLRRPCVTTPSHRQA